MPCSTDRTPGSHRGLHRCAAVRVNGDVAAPAAGFLHHGAQLRLAELRDGLERHRVHLLQVARRVDLDPVGPVLHLLPDGLDHVVGRVGHRGQLGQPLVDLGRQAGQVHVSAGNRQRHGGDQQPGAGDQAVADRVAHGHVGERPPSESMSRRVVNPPRGWRAPRPLPAAPGRRRTVQDRVPSVVRIETHVRVAVDEAGEHREGGQVDDVHPRQGGAPGRHARDAVPFEEDRASVNGSGLIPSIRPPGTDGDRCRGVHGRA